ncbi:toxin-antitoxin system YwqK family antitoxin [Pedobacter sp. WC2501]|uniref:toxin-antitoxin system YwqK family antitoxin n=1 Tax=Pedobacter sp. WC2501 TaxID=3461400 RepID=UPI0040458DEE
MKFIYITMLQLCVLFLQADAQSMKSYFSVDNYSHTVNYDHYKAVFYVQRPEIGLGNIKSDRKYAWYSGNQICYTQGGYSGKLLNGDYNEFYDTKGLKTQGIFEMGLKSGRWKSWGEDGILDSIVNYSSGKPNGRFEKYDQEGVLLERGKYHDGQLNGKLEKRINADSIQVIRYKKGKVMAYQPSKAVKITRWLKSIFKKDKKPKVK